MEIILNKYFCMAKPISSKNFQITVEKIYTLIKYEFVINDKFCVETNIDASMQSKFPILNNYSNPYMFDWSSPTHIDDYTEVANYMLDKYFGIKN